MPRTFIDTAFIPCKAAGVCREIRRRCSGLALQVHFPVYCISHRNPSQTPTSKAVQPESAQLFKQVPCPNMPEWGFKVSSIVFWDTLDPIWSEIISFLYHQKTHSDGF